jgi:hypothetical protein
MFSHGFDNDHEGIGGSFHDMGKGVIHCSITTDSPTEGNGSPDLFIGGKGGLEFDVLNFFRLWWGWGEAC